MENSTFQHFNDNARGEERCGGSSLGARFPKPAIGHICERCRAIPVELFLFGSQFGSNKCRGRHETENCKGKHNVVCQECSKGIDKEDYYHCRICNDNGYDLCQTCRASGKSCGNQEHKLRRMHFEDRKIMEVLQEEAASAEDGEKKKKRAETVQKAMEPYLLFESVSELGTSAESGCHVCSVLATWLDSVPKQFIDSGPAVFIECKALEVSQNFMFMTHMAQSFLVEPDLDATADWGVPQTVAAFRQLNGNPEHDVIRPLVFKIEGSSGHWFSKDHGSLGLGTIPRQISPVVDDFDNLRIVRKWLDACLQHEACSQWPKEPFTPTRLIDVGADQTGSSIRLVDNTSVEKQSAHEYIVLSYCWGVQDQPPTWITTKNNIQSRTKSFPIEGLPKTIVDAVTLARAVGFRYLWVDSICILQDDPDDWIREARSLQSVYTASRFTIISGTDNVTSGLFIPRDQLRVSAAEMTASPVTDLAKPHRVALFPFKADFGLIHRGGPTTKRAWCLQEELLSPRRLYFTKAQFVWECVCSSHEETGTWCAGDLNTSKGYTPPPYPTDVLTYGSKVIGEWYNIVEEYTSRDLTYHKDIFAALAGIAAGLKNKYEENYIAGLWKEDILTGILWQRIGHSLDRPVEYQAPSWSWLSVKGQVLFNRGNKDISTPDAEIVSCNVRTIDDDEFGEVICGSLRLRARLFTCKVTQDGVEHEEDKLHNSDQTIPVKVIHSNEQKELVFTSRPWEPSRHGELMPPGGQIDLTACLKTGDRIFATVFFDGEEEAKLEEICCAYVGVTERREDTRDRNGIALVRVSADDEIPTYRRVGFVAFWDKLIKDDVDFFMDAGHTEFILV